jgi:hypothetical protein
MSLVDIYPTRGILRQNATVGFPLGQRREIGRAVFFSLNSNDPLLRHRLIMRYSASRIQHQG